ncbi:phenylalanine--tRNA ligase subunit alpha [Buchnera aphidicola str. APS (Acyrthosiphon pisum)]|uniref:Phenylalanine--tRNA ligase alpha subunit n=1 Tax=Buchnera aphidicola subsp. Acyrthosiphon pisum (strain APS) TaxID=107806 RepID=SYFA_BUCAI|nr:phenylalanine--tRNA ligase subunit alpha [Buchnera aphidicola]P57229.1 RecName: Full=Phenylalanine--tRNA ligase alpha subunit; AltName: Full=Phenylalanyl-tRNA synthetase alpha subunit; Short=PheRS [Buchnera aphidicola str. APS (Acyrthosiphon pisum)]pir/G84944/ phenylalanine-tRNA ligase (EC 6.1.1.20) alpha chain [imported] - Buchnera sp. (strain APS) [Buchnera sp. (in: enterobacteria)]ADP66525.1 phenylalanyl-tRNA synthetase subunit alpha [Buchnera aphidicola str. TLW03 (Acyrthosiphon pisum)]A
MLNLNKLFEIIEIDIQNSKKISELDKIRIKYLGKKGVLTAFMKKLKDFSYEDKKKHSIIINKKKQEIISKINIKKQKLSVYILEQRIKSETIDISLPGRRTEHGGFHPITNTIDYIKNFFLKLGFQSINSPEIEDEYHNFDALNISKYHPARDSHDTFWFDRNRLLRTQTSSMQIRIMKQEKPPIRFIFPGKVYRNDYDITHTPMFHQIEGLIVDKNINFSNLKWIIYKFLYDFFGKEVLIKFRPSYFPFTVPSAEVDIIDHNGKSLEILGCGMVHPNVLKNVNIDSKIYSACAFGLGIERIAMLRYGITDIRSFFENDIRFLKQFKYN